MNCEYNFVQNIFRHVFNIFVEIEIKAVQLIKLAEYLLCKGSLNHKIHE